MRELFAAIFGFIICRVRNGKRIFSDDVFSPNPFVVLADGRGMDGRLALVSRAAARRLGALEASQVFALGFFGISAASAISVTLVMRARDLLIGGLGLLLAGRMIAK